METEAQPVDGWTVAILSTRTWAPDSLALDGAPTVRGVDATTKRIGLDELARRFAWL